MDPWGDAAEQNFIFTHPERDIWEGKNKIEWTVANISLTASDSIQLCLLILSFKYHYPNHLYKEKLCSEAEFPQSTDGNLCRAWKGID